MKTVFQTMLTHFTAAVEDAFSEGYEVSIFT
jgi:hypothetical protein